MLITVGETEKRPREGGAFNIVCGDRSLYIHLI